MATIQGVYLALFGRPADPLGLAFFNSATSNGADLRAIGPLQSSAEYQTRFAGQSNVQIINSIYQSLFNRAADLPGLTFYSNALANGTLNINNIAIAILDGAQGADRTILDLKLAAANAFTTAVDTAAEVTGYSGTAAAASAQAFIAGVTTTAPTAAQIDAAVAAAVDANVNPVRTLTEGIDIVSGNVFNAPRGFTPGGTDQVNTLNDDDVLTGTGTNPTLNFTFVNDADTGDLNIAPRLTGIQTVNVNVRTDLNSTLDLQDATGVKNVKIDGLDDAVTFTVANVTTAGGLTNLEIRNSNAPDANVVVTSTDAALAGAKDSLALNLNNAQVRSLTVQERPGLVDQGHETIAVTSSGNANSVGQIVAEDLQTLTVAGDQALTLGFTSAVRNGGIIEATNFGPGFGNTAGSFATLDASALKAGITVHLGAEVVAIKDDTSGVDVNFAFTRHGPERCGSSVERPQQGRHD